MQFRACTTVRSASPGCCQAPHRQISTPFTYLPSPVRGKYHYLYLIEDIYSSKAVGWEVYEQENGERASELMERTLLAERCAGRPLVLHSDNGAPGNR